jgi:hypothetical protein
MKIYSFLFAAAISSLACSKSENADCTEIVNEDCACITLYDPVCGCNDKTYSNACEAACVGIEVKYAGKCGK